MVSRIYRMRPEWRRSAIYAIIGGTLLIGGIYWTMYVFLERDPWGTLVFCCLIGLGSLAMIFPLRWALRVDGLGIARRRLLGWDHWAWSDFSSGRIVKSGGFTLFDPLRPWRFRTLTLDFLADAERKEVGQFINQHYRMPDPPALAETLHIKCGWLRRLELLRHEIRLIVRGETFCFGWGQVQRLRITRVEPERRDFVALALSLPGHEIILNRSEKQHWSGAAAEELNEFLLQHVPPERIDIDIFGERPCRAEDVEKELTRITSLERQTRICLSTGALACAGLVAYMAVENRVMNALGMAGLFGVYALGFFAPVYYVSGREVHKRVKQLESWLAELQNRCEPSQHIPLDRP
jgi:hypothetical protein